MACFELKQSFHWVFQCFRLFQCEISLLFSVSGSELFISTAIFRHHFELREIITNVFSLFSTIIYTMKTINLINNKIICYFPTWRFIWLRTDFEILFVLACLDVVKEEIFFLFWNTTENKSTDNLTSVFSFAVQSSFPLQACGKTILHVGFSSGKIWVQKEETKLRVV